MPKRVKRDDIGCPKMAPIDIFKDSETWIIEDDPINGMDIFKQSINITRDLQIQSTNSSNHPTKSGNSDFNETKEQVFNTYVLNYKPRVEVMACLSRSRQEIQFSSSEGVFYITGDEFRQTTNRHSDRYLNKRSKPLQDGVRVATYGKDMSHDFFPINVFDVQTCSMKTFVVELDIMSMHMFNLKSSKPAVLKMFKSVVKVYKKEYARINSFLTRLDPSEEPDLGVIGYTPTLSTARYFANNLPHTYRLNHSNLCGIPFGQRYYVHY